VNEPLEFSRSAIRDFEHAAAWYDAQEGGLGRRFLEAALDARLQWILQNQEVPRPLGPKAIRKCRMDRWPYAIFYRTSTDRVRVLAIIHDARGPKYLSFRLRKP
jgi:plasmid stabilization system protein ParE